MYRSYFFLVSPSPSLSPSPFSPLSAGPTLGGRGGKGGEGFRGRVREERGNCKGEGKEQGEKVLGEIDVKKRERARARER